MSNLSRQLPQYEGTQGSAANLSEALQYALTERNTPEAAQEPGAHWSKFAALIPVSQLVKYREFDRNTTPKYSHEDSQKTIESLTNELKAGGVHALRSPLNMTYDHKNHWAYLGEGNHRLVAAIRAGITHLPVHISKEGYGMFDDRKAQRVGAPLHLDNRLVEKGGYMPARLHPGNFMEFANHR